MGKNIYSIAEEAGVSTATVSRVLNNKSNVSEDTRKKVLSVIEKMNYFPNSLARGLAVNKTLIIGILAVNVQTAHYAKTVDSLCSALTDKGFCPILFKTDGNIETNVRHLRTLISLGCCAVLCIGSVFRDTLLNATVISEFSDIPFILNNCRLSAENIYSVMIDEQYAVEMCLQHLTSQGYDRLAYVKDASSESGKRKQAAFISLCQEYKLPMDDALIVETRRGLEGGRQAVDKLVGTGLPFNGVLFGDDTTAVGGLKRLIELGYKIPGEMAVMGFNNNIASLCCSPTISTVNTKIETITLLMVDTLEQILNDNDPAHMLTVAPELLIRESTVRTKKK